MSDAIIPEREVEEQELYHAKSWWTEKVFSQDAKIIGIQYFCTATAIALIGLVLSWFMRMQIGFPGLSIVSESFYYQAITCLLYTSPSPRDGLLSRMPSSA